MGSCTVACGHPGCGRRYGHPDAARKHARRHHAEWVALRDAEKLPCYTLVGDDDVSMPLPVHRQASDVGSDCGSLSVPIQRPIQKKPPKAKMARSTSLPKDMDARARSALWGPDGLPPAFGAGRAFDDATSVMMHGHGTQRSPNAFQLLVAAAIAASDNDESETPSPRSIRPMADAEHSDAVTEMRAASPLPEPMNADDTDEPMSGAGIDGGEGASAADRGVASPASSRLMPRALASTGAAPSMEADATGAVASTAASAAGAPLTPTASHAQDDAESRPAAHYASRHSEPVSASGLAPPYFHAHSSSDGFQFSAAAAGASRGTYAHATQAQLTAM